MSPIGDLFVQAAEELGYKALDINGAEQEGTVFQICCSINQVSHSYVTALIEAYVLCYEKCKLCGSSSMSCFSCRDHTQLSDNVCCEDSRFITIEQYLRMINDDLFFCLCKDCFSLFVGFSRVHYTIENGVRSSTAKAYLRPAMARTNLDVATLAPVNKVRGTKVSMVTFTDRVDNWNVVPPPITHIAILAMKSTLEATPRILVLLSLL